MMGRLTVDSRMLGAALLAAVAALVVLAMTRPPDTTDVLVAVTPAAAGTRLGDAELTTRPVSDPAGLIPADELTSIADHVLAVDLDVGMPLVMSMLGSPEGAGVVDVVGLELRSDAAVHGVLVPGDSVDVYVTSSPDQPVARSVTVVGVFTDRGSLGVGDVGLLLAVDDELAPIVVGASDAGAIHLVRRGG